MGQQFQKRRGYKMNPRKKENQLRGGVSLLVAAGWALLLSCLIISIDPAHARELPRPQERTVSTADHAQPAPDFTPPASWAEVEDPPEMDPQQGLRKWNGILRNVPDDYTPMAAGKVFVLHVFIDDTDTEWTDSIWPWVIDRGWMADLAKDGCDFIADEAPGAVNLQFSNHGDLTYTYYYYDVDVDFVVPNRSADGTDWPEDAVAELGFTNDDEDAGSGTNVDDMLDHVLSLYPDYEWAIALFHVNKGGRSWASNWRSTSAIYPERTNGSSTGAATFAHEIMHLFGATDEYEDRDEDGNPLDTCPRYHCDEEVSHNWLDWEYENENCEPCADDLDNESLMLTTTRSWFWGPDNTLTPCTRGSIGWRDGDSDGTRDFAEAAPYCWFTTPDPTEGTTSSSISLSGRAWSPHSDIDDIAYQVNDVVDEADWSYVPGPADGAWDEHDESFSFTASLDEGINTVWIKAHNSAGNWQNSNLDSYQIRRDTTGPTVPNIYANGRNPAQWETDHDILISWSGCTDPSGVDGYSIVVNQSATGDPPHSFPSSGTSYQFLVYQTGTYYAHLAAVDGLGNWGPTNHFQVLVDQTDPGMPTIQSSTHTEDVWTNQTTATFSWSAIDNHSGIDGYEWERNFDAQTQLATNASSATQVTLHNLPDGIQYFHVSAKDEAGNWGFTDHFRLKIETDPPPAPPPTHTSPLVGYEWYRTDTVTFGWGSPSGPAGIAGFSYNLTAGQTGVLPDETMDTGTLSATYSGLTSGYHTFSVRSLDNAGNWGPAGHVTIGLDITAPQAVTNLVTTSHPDAVGQLDPDQSANPFVTIQFGAAIDSHSGLANHAVLWNQSASSLPTYQNNTSMGPGTIFTSPELTTGNWYVHVGAVDMKDNWSLATDVVTLGPIVIDVTPPGSPTALTATSGSSQVDLSWCPPGDDDIGHYVVYRSEDEDLLGTAIATAVTDTFYNDSPLTNGEKYYYRVCAVDDVDLVSDPSGQATGRPEYVSPGNGSSFTSLAVLRNASNGGVRDDGAGGYTMHGSVTISASDTLHIGPGERLRSVDRTGTRQLIIQGTLRAIGAPGNRALIGATWTRAGAWGGINMNPPSGNSRLEEVEIRYGVTDVLWHGSSPTIIDCEISHASGAGLDLSAGGGGNCLVRNNAIRSCGGRGLDVFAPPFSSTDIDGNTISQNQDGIAWTTLMGANPPNIVDIHDNRVQNNTQDGIACGYGGATTFIRDNIVHANSRGIVFEWEGWMMTTPVIQSNLVSSNSVAGIYVSNQAQPDILDNMILANPNRGVHSHMEGAPRLRGNTIHGSMVGVAVTQSNFMVPDMGTVGSFGTNRLDQHSVAYVSNATAVGMNAMGNYWGTAQAAPGAVIVGPVAFMPVWAPAAPNSAPTITVTQPAGGGQTTSTTAQITWTDGDADPADTLSVSFFYDDDGIGLDGVGIAGGSGLDGWDPADSLCWDVTQVPAGDYFVYGVISDGELTASSYSTGTITVIHPELSVPTDTLTVKLSRGATATLPLTLRSVGNATVSGNLTEDDGGGQAISWLALSDTTFSLDPADSVVVDLELDATGLADNVYRGLVHVFSNDPSDTLQTVPVALSVVHPQIAVSPSSIDFGTASVGDSLRVSLAVYNTGSDTLRVDSLTGLNSPFTAEILADSTAAPGDTLQVGVTAGPTGRGSFSDQLLINSTDPDNPQLGVSLSLYASNPCLGLPQTSHNFGNVALGDSASWTLPVTNTGEDTLNVSGISSSTAVFKTPASGSFAVAAGETAQVQVRFLPGSAGLATGTLTIVDNDPASTGTVSLTGFGLAGDAAFGDTALVFTSVSLGDSTDATAWLHNLGDTSFQVTGAATDGPFDLVTTGAPWTVSAGDSLGLAVRFQPVLGGEATGQLSATTTDGQGSSPLLALRGTGLEPGFAWDLSELAFGSVEIESVADTTIVLRNPGDGTVNVSGGLLDGTSFEILSPGFPATISANDSLEVALRFAPDLVTTSLDTLLLTTPWSFLDTCLVTLSGTGIAADLTLPSLSHNFGPVRPGNRAVWAMPITNEGALAVDVQITTPGSPFGLLDTSPVTVPGASTVEVSVSFEPSGLGACTDSLQIHWDDPPVLLGTIQLAGEGVEAGLEPPETEIVADVFEDDTVRETLTLANQGSGSLYFGLLEMGEVSAKTAGLAKAGDGTGQPPGLAALKERPRRGNERRIGQLDRRPSRGRLAGPDSRPGGRRGPQPRDRWDPVPDPVEWLADIEEIDIPWVTVSVPYNYILPDSTADALIDLDSEGLTPAVYQGELLLLTSDATAESTTIDLTMRVPRMRYATHDTGNIRLTVTDEGAIGFFDADQMEAYGAGLQWPPGAPSVLFHGSFWIADGPDRVSDASYDYDFEVVSGGGLTTTAGDPQTTHCLFDDVAAPNPLGVQVEQTTFAFAGAPDADYVIFDLVLTSAVVREDVYVGLYLDADINDLFANTGSYVPSVEMGQMYAASGPDTTRVGIVSLHGPGPRAFRLIHNPTYVWPQDDFIDSDAWGFLTSGTFDDGVPTPDDYSMVLAVGPVTLDPAQPVRLGFAVVAGGSEATLTAAATAARAQYPSLVTEAPDPEGLPLRFALDNPYPNPFNPRVFLPMAAPAGGGEVRLELFDVRGRRVRTLFAGFQAEGRSVAVWDGRDDSDRAVASGVYFVRFTAPGVQGTRKIMLVR